MKTKSFDPRMTLSILRSKSIDPKKWDKIQHTSKNIIVLYRTTNGKLESLVVKEHE